MKIYANSIETVGATPLVRLNTIAKDYDAEILAKLEFFNPLGSVKDRIGASMIKAAEEDGSIGPDSLIVVSSNTDCPSPSRTIIRCPFSPWYNSRKCSAPSGKSK